MNTKRLYNWTFTLFTVLLFVASFSIAGSSAAIPLTTTVEQEERNELTSHYPIDYSSISNQGTNVDWYTDNGSYNSSWTWSNNNWLFGPVANYEIFFANGSQVDRLGFIPVNEEITWRINIPKSILRGAGIANVYTNGYYSSPTVNFSAGFNFDFYNYTPATWSVSSYSWNQTSGYNGPPYISINQPSCSFTEDYSMYYVTFKIMFNSNTPAGLYNLHSTVYDTSYNSFDVKSRYSSDYYSNRIAIAIPWSQAFSATYYGFYTLEKQDLAGDTIYSVSRGTDFMMRFNITGNGDLDYAMLWSYYSGEMKIPVNRTGYHNAMVTKTGGWIYDPAIETYVYDSSVQFTVQEMVWGDYLDYEYVYASDYRDYEYRYLMYNYSTGIYDIYTSTSSSQMSLIHLFNFTTMSFETIYGFVYYTYPSDVYQPELSSERVFYEEPIDNAPFQLFELNEDLSTSYMHDGVICVEFIGHFTEDVPRGSVVNFNDAVVDCNGFSYSVSAGSTADALMTWQEYNQAKQVAVETPVTIAKLLKVDGSSSYGWFFSAELNEPFKVQGRLQGGADLSSDIDGAIFMMKSYDSLYTGTSYAYTDMYYEILVRSDKSVTLTAYNYTAMQNYTYGYHWEWGYYLTTGWHYEYDAATGSTVWIYGDYYTYGDQWIEGWYWDWFYFDQRTSQWVSSKDWYYYGVQSEATRVSDVFADVTNINIFTSGGDLYYSFLVNLTGHIREITHYWDFKFANNTWLEDPSSAMGFHDVAIWRPGWIHSFEYLDDDIYVDVSAKIGVFNGSISGMSDWVAVDEMPFITIDGVNYPIRVRNIIYPYSTMAEERLLFYDNNGYYYELLNGTKIYIENGRIARIYNITIPGYGSFLSAQKASLYWFDGTNYWYSWFDIYGNLHQGTDYITWEYDVVVKFIDDSEAVFDAHYLRIGTSSILKIQDYPRNDPRTGTLFVLDEIGTRYDMYYDYYQGCYYINYDGLLQVSSYTLESYKATYLGNPVFVPRWDVLQEQWFTVEGHDEMPYPGAFADWTGVYCTDATYNGKVQTTKAIVVGEKTYFLGGNPDVSSWYMSDCNNHTGFWIIIDSLNYSLDGRKMWHASVNGSSYWQPLLVGGTLDYGHFDGMAFQIEGSIITPHEYLVYHDYNYTHYYEYNWRVDFENGTVFSCEPRTMFEVYLVNADDTLIFTTNPYPTTEYLNETVVFYVRDLNGAQYYVDSSNRLPILDVIVTSGWTEWDTNGVGTFHYIVNGTEYVEVYSGGHGGTIAMMFTNGTLTGKYFFRYADHNNAVYEVYYKGSYYQVASARSYIHQIGSVLGKAYIYELTPIQSVTFKNFQEIIVGNPRWALWGVQSWSRSGANNALDLDGNTDTTDDQYFVLSEYQSTNTWSSEWSRMWVNLMWDPNGTLYGDEMNTYSWMGVETYTWSYQWQETYYWYHATDLTPVSSADWLTIKSTILNEDGLPRAGYWDIAHMARNVTWEDIVSQAIENGWDWFKQGEQTWTWLSFGVGQHYGVNTEVGWSSINLRYEYSGLMIWEDSNNNSIMEAYLTHPGDGELTHYFIPDSVGSVSFVTPGLAYGVPSQSGSLLLGVEDEITWGVSFRDVNGTTFPFNAYAYWDWYGGVVTGSDLKTFDERPTKVTIDEISFLVHFQGAINSTEGATCNYATMKVDNTVGQWGVKLIGGTDNLEGKSLALNYLADVSTAQFRTNASGIGQEQTVVSDRFEIGDSSSRFAEMIIGGVTYEWAKDPYTPYNVSSQTTPYSTFTSAYQSDNGQSATSWEFTSTQYYVSIGFPAWDGYYVYQDPVFVGYISNTGQSGIGGVEFASFSISPIVPSESDFVTVSVDIYTDLTIWSAELTYSTDGVNFHDASVMSLVSANHWTGTIPPFAENTQVWYKVVITTEGGIYESVVQSYIVGQGSVTITTTVSTTTTTGYTGTTPGLSLELMMMVGGVGGVVVILALMAKRRK